MRKLLLGTTAIAAAATLTANAALADVSISGAYEFYYQSRSSNQGNTVDGTSTDTDSEIKVTFSNQTDSGLSLSFVSELGTDEGDTMVSLQQTLLLRKLKQLVLIHLH